MTFHLRVVRWATDGAKIWTTDDGWLWLFTTLEDWNAECLGHHVCQRGDRFAAYEPVAQAVTRVFGTSAAADAARDVELRHDHGSPYLTDWFQGQSRFHGFTPSFAFVGEPETNGGVERFKRTLKEQIIHGRTYRNRAELAATVTTFVATYNREWRLEKLRYQSPPRSPPCLSTLLPFSRLINLCLVSNQPVPTQPEIPL